MSDKAIDFFTFSRHKHRLIPFISLAVVCAIIATKKAETVFHIEATTEIIKIDSLSKSTSNMTFYKARVYDESFEVVSDTFNGEFEPNAGITLVIERVSNGQPLIYLSKDDGDGIVGRLIDYETQTSVGSLKSGSIIVLPHLDSLLAGGNSFVFPFAGRVELGKKIGYSVSGETSPILRSGSIILSSKSIITGERFRARELGLQAGDNISFKGDNYGYGFVGINETPALQTSFRILSPEATVRKTGPEDLASGYSLSTSLYSRISNDRWYQIAIALGALILFLTGIARFVRDFFPKSKSKVEHNEK